MPVQDEVKPNEQSGCIMILVFLAVVCGVAWLLWRWSPVVAIVAGIAIVVAFVAIAVWRYGGQRWVGPMVARIAQTVGAHIPADWRSAHVVVERSDHQSEPSTHIANPDKPDTRLPEIPTPVAEVIQEFCMRSSQRGMHWRQFMLDMRRQGDGWDTRTDFVYDDEGR